MRRFGSQRQFEIDMNETLDTEKDNFRKYLLQELPEAQQEQIEMRLLTDQEFGRRLAIAQDDLIDDFVTSRLSDHEEQRFREHYLITLERQQKIGFAAALDRYVTETTSAKKGPVFQSMGTYVYAKPFKSALAMAGLLLLFGTGFFILWRAQSAQKDLQQEFARVNHPEETESIPYSLLKQSSGNTPVLTLRENVVREDGDSRKVEIGSGVTLVRLLLELGVGSYSSFNVRLQTANDHELASLGNMKARDEEGAQFVVINVPAEFLTSGDYQVRLTGISSDGRATDLGLYPFRVIRSTR